MDWMNQNANAGGYDPNTAPVNLSPFANRAVGVTADVVGQGFNQMAAFGAGAAGVNHAFSNTPVYDKLVREPAGDQTTVAPNFAQRAGAVLYDVGTSPFRALKSIGHYIDPTEVGSVASYTPSYDVVRGLDAKAAAANAGLDADGKKPIEAGLPGIIPGSVAGLTGDAPDASKVKMSKAVVNAPQQQAAAAPNPNAPAGMPLGALMEIAKIANTRKVISARDHIMGEVYGWHRQNMEQAKAALTKNPNDKAAQESYKSSLGALTSIVSPQGYVGQQIYGQQDQIP